MNTPKVLAGMDLAQMHAHEQGLEAQIAFAATRQDRARIFGEPQRVKRQELGM